MRYVEEAEMDPHSPTLFKLKKVLGTGLIIFKSYMIHLFELVHEKFVANASTERNVTLQTRVLIQ